MNSSTCVINSDTDRVSLDGFNPAGVNIVFSRHRLHSKLINKLHKQKDRHTYNAATFLLFAKLI